VLAKELATLDRMSAGRVEPGLGAGFLRREYDQAGLTFDPAGVRVTQLEESLRVLKAQLRWTPQLAARPLTSLRPGPTKAFGSPGPT